MDYDGFLQALAACVEEQYRDFSSALVKGRRPMLGVRLPECRRLARQYAPCQEAFFEHLANRSNPYFEEVMVAGLMLNYLHTDFEQICSGIECYLPYIKDWSCCDSPAMGLKRLRKHPQSLPYAAELTQRENPWAQRFGFVLLLSACDAKENLALAFEAVQQNKNPDYYVMMARAWLLCEITTKHPEQGAEFLRSGRTDTQTLNKAISKCCDSYRISPELKDQLRALRWRNTSDNSAKL